MIANGVRAIRNMFVLSLADATVKNPLQTMKMRLDAAVFAPKNSYIYY